MTAAIPNLNGHDAAHISVHVHGTPVEDFLTVMLGDQIFGIPIMQVQDILSRQKVTRVPLAPPEISGSLNLRGRIVTAINMRQRLGMNLDDRASKDMNVVIEHGGDLYSLIFDAVGDVLSLDKKDYEDSPSTLDPILRSVSSGIYRLENTLLVVLDIPRMLRSIGDVNGDPS